VPDLGWPPALIVSLALSTIALLPPGVEKGEVNINDPFVPDTSIMPLEPRKKTEKNKDFLFPLRYEH
jgi:hypothetical protein